MLVLKIHQEIIPINFFFPSFFTFPTFSQVFINFPNFLKKWTKLGDFPNFGAKLGKTNFKQKACKALQNKDLQAISLYRLFIFPSFNSIFTMFMQICFLLVYKKYFLLTIHLHQQKINEKTLKPVTFILTHFHQKINSFLLWKILLPSILLFLSHIFSPIFIFPEHLKLPIYNALKEK